MVWDVCSEIDAQSEKRIELQKQLSVESRQGLQQRYNRRHHSQNSWAQAWYPQDGAELTAEENVNLTRVMDRECG
ncbi:hypothetical protein PILCRDRAFT_433288 [Piloderma croceum F 1598]|uniref:Uncharacterized protein n=1 Tax=Piloderma croceum (strain F 1598) TaxID=765440 RepID=A0A0C3BBM1_PILCF|nr:hypothetical protein PILCRDRAFT_433288 [Piloderma croceum F 1598]